MPTRGSSFFLGKVTALGVLCCFALLVVYLTLLASFFFPSASLIKTCTMYIHELMRPGIGRNVTSTMGGFTSAYMYMYTCTHIVQ